MAVTRCRSASSGSRDAQRIVPSARAPTCSSGLSGAIQGEYPDGLARTPLLACAPLGRTRRIVMATNLVSLVMQFVTPDMIARIASVLGLDRETTQKAVSGAVPAILSGLAGVASAPGGVQQLSNALMQQGSG